tara:strand:- start:226 stop:570 length:345 start_codon:yes stop_codon:yes gene_type:complete
MESNNHKNKVIKELSQDEISQTMLNLKDWKYKNGSIEKTFSFSDYLQGVKFVNQCANLAEQKQHHPEIIILYKEIRIIYTTHDVGNKVSMKDIESATDLEILYGKFLLDQNGKR